MHYTIKMIILMGLERGSRGSRDSKRIRSNHYVPALVSNKSSAYHIMLKAPSLKELHNHSTNRIAKLFVRADSFLVLLKSSQHHNISGGLQHLELSILSSSGILRTKVPIKVVRSDKRNQGYTCCVLKGSVEVNCPALKIPNSIRIKPNQLDSTNKRLRAKQLPLPTGTSLSWAERTKNAVIITLLPLRREGPEDEGEKTGVVNKKASSKEASAPSSSNQSASKNAGPKQDLN